MRVPGTNIIVEQNSDPNKVIGNIIFDHSKKYTKNMGGVKYLSKFCETNRGTICDINIGDIVHFSDEAGVYIDKKNMKNILLIDYREIILISESEENEIFVGEDMRFYLEEDIANRQMEKTSNN